MNIFKVSWHVFVKTFPYHLIRVLVGLVLLAVTLVAVGAGLFLIFSDRLFAGIFLIIGFFVIFSPINRWVTYTFKMGHITLIADVLQQKEIPRGFRQFQHALAIVKERLPESIVFTILDYIIKEIVKLITFPLAVLRRTIPVKGVKNLISFIELVLSYFFNLIDEAVFAYIFIAKQENVFKAAKDGLILYFESWKEILKTVVIIVAIEIGLFFLLFYGGMFLFSLVFGDVAAIGGIISGLALFLLFEVLFFGSFKLIAVVSTYLYAIQGKRVDAASSQKLASFPIFKQLDSLAAKKEVTKEDLKELKRLR